MSGAARRHLAAAGRRWSRIAGMTGGASSPSAGRFGPPAQKIGGILGPQAGARQGINLGFAAGFASSAGPRGGPVGYGSLALAMATGIGMVLYYNSEKDKRMKEIKGGNKTLGKAALGGPFELLDSATGKMVTDKDFHGKFLLLYFGFTHCPDICPDELEKVAEAIDLAEKQSGAVVTPVFVSIDPERDTAAKVKAYCSEFHPRMVGLTGTVEQCKAAARQYRVYASKTGGSKDDYLVDHSIIHYLIGPDGSFMTFYGKNHTAEEMAKQLSTEVKNYAGGSGKGFLSGLFS